MKVALLHHLSLSYVGGGEKFLLEVASFLRGRGHDVEIRSLPVNKRKEGFKPPRGVRWVEKFFHNFDADIAYFLYAPLVRNLFKTDAPVIAGMHGPPLFPELQSHDTFSGNLVEIIRKNDFYSALEYWSTKAGVVKLDLKKFEAIHLINRAMRVEHPNTFYIPLFIDLDFYKPRSKKRKEFTVLFVGRPLRMKGFDIFTETATLVRKRNKKIKFLATGPGNEVVEGLGFVPEEKLPELYSSVHLVMYPSRIDTFGKVILEALACGTPVLTTPIKAHKALDLPLLYSSTPKGFAKKILNFYERDKESRIDYQAISRKCREAVKKYDASKILPKFENMLERVAKTN
ncbi:hypothetical protein DRN63_01325 [Nanoarchaeota archaeon]|nr:MAG: hypothetical protein DRN63_01325 [Nanoarchaeota archaeon]